MSRVKKSNPEICSQVICPIHSDLFFYTFKVEQLRPCTGDIHRLVEATYKDMQLAKKILRLIAITQSSNDRALQSTLEWEEKLSNSEHQLACYEYDFQNNAFIVDKLPSAIINNQKSLEAVESYNLLANTILEDAKKNSSLPDKQIGHLRSYLLCEVEQAIKILKKRTETQNGLSLLSLKDSRSVVPSQASWLPKDRNSEEKLLIDFLSWLKEAPVHASFMNRQEIHSKTYLSFCSKVVNDVVIVDKHSLVSVKSWEC